MIDTAMHNLNLHETLRSAKFEDESFKREYKAYARKYRLPEPKAGL